MTREEAIDTIMKEYQPADVTEAERRAVVSLMVDSIHRNGYVVVPCPGVYLGIKLMRGITPKTKS